MRKDKKESHLRVIKIFKWNKQLSIVYYYERHVLIGY